jgi:isopentenyldiphosphate isomerase
MEVFSKMTSPRQDGFRCPLAQPMGKANGGMSLIDVLGKNGLPTGKQLSEEHVHKQGALHRVVQFFLMDSRNNLLVHRRVHTADRFPGMWSLFLERPVYRGENSQKALGQVLNQTLGLKKEDVHTIKPLFSYRSFEKHSPSSIHRQINEVFSGIMKKELQVEHLRFNPHKFREIKLVPITKHGPLVQELEGHLAPLSQNLKKKLPNIWRDLGLTQSGTSSAYTWKVHPDRPLLQPGMAEGDLDRYYWYKEELVAYCRHQGIPPQGQKHEIMERVRHHLKGLALIPLQKMSSAAPSSMVKEPGEITRDTPIGPNYKCNATTRAFFESVIGSHFHFTAHLQQFRRANEGRALTYGDLADEWVAEQERRKDKSYQSPLMPTWEYNRFIRDYMADTARNKGKTLKDAAAAWKIVRESRGPRDYASSLKLEKGRVEEPKRAPQDPPQN